MAFYGSVEPLLPREGRPELDDAAFELVREASSLSGKLPEVIVDGVGDLVRSMNCYYSNLIEGHPTLPRDIERAMAEEYSAEPVKRDLQLEARAHIEVQRMIDTGQDPTVDPVSAEYILWLHRSFCERLPESLLWVENPDTGERLRVEPGKFRRHPVKVGRHIPPDPEELGAAMRRFEEGYAGSMSKFRKVIAVAAAHHRLLWIHPFLDGNGRVARLLSHAMFQRLEIGNSLWAVSRGLARQVTDYKRLLQAADKPRTSDLDGRGNLSEMALAGFCEFFLMSSVDQVRYMRSILEPTTLIRRLELYCAEEHDAGRLPAAAFPILREAVLAGEVPRSQVPGLIQLKERAARNVTAALLKSGLLVSDHARSNLRLGFPLHAVERWFPALYPAS